MARPALAVEDAARAFQDQVRPVLETYCTPCHGAKKQKAKLDFSTTRSPGQLAAEVELWYRVLDKVEAGEMPPEDEKQPSPEERDALTRWVRGEYTAMLLERRRQEGRGKLRRLSRQEYVNTVEDLLGVRPAVERYLPADGLVDGYNKVSAALPLSAESAMGYLEMAAAILDGMFKRPAKAGATLHAPARDSGESPGHSLVLKDGTVVSFNSDTTSGRLDFDGIQVPGRYRLRISVHGYQTDRPLPFGVYTGRTGGFPQEIELASILAAPPGHAAVLETEVYLRRSDGVRLIPFGIGVQVPKNSQASQCRGPGLALQWVELQPLEPLRGDRWLTADFPPALLEEMRRRERMTLAADGKSSDRSESITRAGFLEVLRKTFARLGPRFYRRDLRAPELEAIVESAARNLDAGEPMGLVFFDQVIALMTAPDFLCLIEEPGPLDDFALASRLSYLLWNSGPDERLLDLARAGHLHEAAVLAGETDRLLKDAKARRFVEDFTGQWLNLRAIGETSPDGQLYPGYDDLLRHSSLTQTRETVWRMLAENLSVRQLVASPWALLNEPLARQCGIPGVTGLSLQKVALPAGSPYGGLWTQPAVLKVTANGTNTSPVKRGVFVSERLLGIHIPPPPSDINPIEPDTRGARTVREQLALHRNNDTCAACHAHFDPYGFALESFDVVGGFRKNYRVLDPEVAALPADQRQGRQTWRDGLPVDPSGQTPDGHRFADIGELRQVLAGNPAALARGVTRHLVTYATGTPPGRLDEPAIEAIVRDASRSDYGLRTLLHGVVQSELFRCK